ncbi:hypothetical protein C1H46_038229 [Malus baccata]|uniref:Uncharacterized protein n=1 Tax=Malus baccata TaxID=106549 RepID=A0A540KQB0_MALBA|nr:hypothetical protein C1H46_038229 [Malus baccata]
MAAAFLFSHSGCRGFQTQAQWTPSHFSAGHSCKSANFPGKAGIFPGNLRNTSIGCNFVVKGCLQSQHHPHNQSHSNSIKRHPNAQLVRDLELDLRSSDTVGLTSSNGCQERGGRTGIPHHSLPGDKLVVAVDVDEVLGNFVSALNCFIADRYSSNHSVSEYHVYEFFKNVIKDHTLQWIEQHFSGLFQEIHFGNHWALHGESRPKSEICRSLGAKVLIDDNPRYALECAEVGIRVLLFDYENSYPWCKTESIDQHPLVTKVHNWEAVEKQLMTINSIIS